MNIVLLTLKNFIKNIPKFIKEKIWPHYKLIVTCIAVVSIIGNVYTVVKYRQIKRTVTDIVDSNIDKVVDNTLHSNDDINKHHDDTISKLQYLFDNNLNTTFGTYEQNAETGEEYVVYNFAEMQYKILLAESIEQSRRQTIFAADKLNFLTAQYELESVARNLMISNLEQELAEAKEKLITDVTGAEMQQLINNNIHKAFRFGMDVYVTNTLPINSIINGTYSGLGYFGGGLGLDMLFYDKVFVRTNFGLQYDGANLNPNVGVSVGWYFN